jgi:hypothetical protein
MILSYPWIKAILQYYLDAVGCGNNMQSPGTPLPLDFALTMEVRSNTSKKGSATSYRIQPWLCFLHGSLIYLSVTRVDILHTVNKLAKLIQKPGRIHFLAINHVLRNLWDDLFFWSIFLQ